LEKRVVTPPKQELPRSQSLRENLKPVSPTPSPPTTKPKWSASTSSTSKANDPVKERLLAARSGLSKTQPKPPTFSDPLKDGILAAREKLKVQDKQREKKEDELKASIMNARKGLRRPGSREETDRPVPGPKIEKTPPPREREKTPVIEEEEVIIKQEEITPEKPKFDKVESKPVIQKPSQSELPKPQSIAQSASIATQPKQTEAAETRPIAQKPVERTPSETRTNTVSLQTKPVDIPSLKPLPSKSSSSPIVQKKTAGPGPVLKSSGQQSEPTKKENDNPTPRKKIEKTIVLQPRKKEDGIEVPSKSSEPAKPLKQTSLPTAEKTATVKGT